MAERLIGQQLRGKKVMLMASELSTVLHGGGKDARSGGTLQCFSCMQMAMRRNRHRDDAGSEAIACSWHAEQTACQVESNLCWVALLACV